MFEIKLDKGRSLVRVKLSGFMTLADVNAFASAEQALLRENGLASGEYSVLIDSTATVLQSRDVVAGFEAMMATSPLRAKRIAVVYGQSLSRMQLRRILKNREGAAPFADHAAAQLWLFSPAEAEAA